LFETFCFYYLILFIYLFICSYLFVKKNKQSLKIKDSFEP